MHRSPVGTRLAPASAPSACPAVLGRHVNRAWFRLGGWGLTVLGGVSSLLREAKESRLTVMLDLRPPLLIPSAVTVAPFPPWSEASVRSFQLNSPLSECSRSSEAKQARSKGGTRRFGDSSVVSIDYAPCRSAISCINTMIGLARNPLVRLYPTDRETQSSHPQ